MLVVNGRRIADDDGRTDSNWSPRESDDVIKLKNSI